MGGGAQREAIRRNAEAQERIANTQTRLGDEQIQTGREDRAFQKELFDRIAPFAESLIGTFNADDYGDGSPFPDIQRPDFSANIRRDYADDLAGIEAGKNKSVGNALETLSASGLSRSGIATGGLGAIMRGSEADRSLARRTMQDRLEMENRDAYADSRDLALMEHGDTRGRESERANLATAGANILAGQQGTFSPQPWYAGGGSSYNAATGSLGNASGARFNSTQIPGAWSQIGGAVGAGLGAAGTLASGGGLSSVWRGRR